MADAADSKSADGDIVQVQVLSPVLLKECLSLDILFLYNSLQSAYKHTQYNYILKGRLYL